MRSEPVHVAVLIVSYNGRRFLPECLGSLRSGIDRCGGVRVSVCVVDNASIDGSADDVALEHPWVELVRSKKNLGFAGGNNLGWDHLRARHPDVAFVYLLNQDAVVAGDWLTPLLDTMQADATIAAAQPLILLHDRPDRINTAGNRCHYLGFTFVTEFGQPADAVRDIRDIDAFSGAAVLLRRSAVEEVGELFPSEFFMYGEDVDLSWRLRLAGHRLVCVPDARVHHHYQPDAWRKNVYYLERNRWLLLLTHYRRRTLALLAPMLAVTTIIQLAHAQLVGQLRPHLRGLMAAFRPGAAGRRPLTRRLRRRSDRQWLRGCTARLDLPDGQPVLLRWVVQPLWQGYWAIIRRLLLW